MPKWKVQVSGDLPVLEEAAMMFCMPGLTIARQGDSFYLSSDCFEGLEEVPQVEALASKLLARANALVGLVVGEHNPLKAACVIDTPEGCPPTTYLSCCVDVVVFGRATTDPPDPVVDQLRDSGTAHALAAVASNDASVDDALRFWETKPRTFGTLYKVYEVIRQDAGGAMVKSGWATQAEVNRFRASANRPELSGDDARHARHSGPPPTLKPMTQDEAAELIARVLRHWLLSKRDSSE